MRPGPTAGTQRGLGPHLDEKAPLGARWGFGSSHRRADAAELDPSHAVRLAAVHALGLFSSPAAAASLLQLLHDSDQDEELRADAAEALAHYWDEAIVDTLIACLDDGSALVHYSAAYALGEQGNPKALPKLAELAARDRAVTRWGDVASRAQEAIEAIQGRDSAE